MPDWNETAQPNSLECRRLLVAAVRKTELNRIRFSHPTAHTTRSCPTEFGSTPRQAHIAAGYIPLSRRVKH